MLDLLMPFQSLRDLRRGMQHIVNLDGLVGPPWRTLCSRQIVGVPRSDFTARLDDGPRCIDCETRYKLAVNPSGAKLKTSRPAPPR